MARIAGVNVPDNKHIEIALTAVYGIGKMAILKKYIVQNFLVV